MSWLDSKIVCPELSSLYVLILSAAHVELPTSLLTPPNAPSIPQASSAPSAPITVKKESKKKHYLTVATDPLYAELRDLNFSRIGRKLNKVAHRLDENYKASSSVLLTSIYLLLTVKLRPIYNQRPLHNFAILWESLVVSKASTKPSDFVRFWSVCWSNLDWH